MAKPLGIGGAKKWTEALASHTEGGGHLNVQSIPLEVVQQDPENSRRYLITLDDVKNGPKLIASEFDEDVQEKLTTEISTFFSSAADKERKIEEYLSLAQFAASIGSAEGLLNPITVYMEQMVFHLVAGHRRTLAHFILDEKQIAAHILANKPDKLMRSVLQWRENEDRQDLSLAERLSNVARVVQAWEEQSNAAISVRKLMSLLSLKKTQSTWFSKVIRENDPIFRQAIESGTIRSLEVAYNISSMDDISERHALISQLKNGVPYTFNQLKKKIKSPLNTTVKKSEKLEHYGLVLKKTTNIPVIVKIIQATVELPELEEHKNELMKLNLKRPKDVLAAWQIIYQLLEDAQEES
ncbi:MAG: hypothetical protein GXO88_11535 [Chlorobi bacterium]|nr:hypothetical protein [Chlorobiota bacterium]